MLNRMPRAETLVPMVKAALERGEGPPAVLAWVKAQGRSTARPEDVMAMAGRLAESLRPRAELRTGNLTATGA